MANQVVEATLNFYESHREEQTVDGDGSPVVDGDGDPVMEPTVSLVCEGKVCDPSNANKIAARGENLRVELIYDPAKTVGQVKADAIAALLVKADQ